MSVSNLYTPHARERALERYGIAPNKTVAREIVGRIRNGNATLVGRTSLSRTTWDVTIGETVYRCVYSKSTGRIITFLTLNRDARDAP